MDLFYILRKNNEFNVLMMNSLKLHVHIHTIEANTCQMFKKTNEHNFIVYSDSTKRVTNRIKEGNLN